jgi:hypothetical protein
MKKIGKIYTYPNNCNLSNVSHAIGKMGIRCFFLLGGKEVISSSVYQQRAILWYHRRDPF